MIKLYSKGGSDGKVTGSRHFLNIDGQIFQIDCGLFQGKRFDASELNKQITVEDNLKAVVLTHAHADHSAMLPYLVKQGYSGPIYATSATRDLANIIMLDSAKIQSYDYKYLRKESNDPNKSFVEPLFNEQDCINAVEQINTFPYDRRIHISSDVEIEMFDAGHILGSSMIEFFIKNKKNKAFKKNNSLLKRLMRETDDEVRVLFTGDLGRPIKPILKTPSVNVIAPDYIVLESTYGNRLHKDIKHSLMDLSKIINEAIAKEGKIIIPAFSVERTQELIYFIHEMVNKKWIPKIPIYIDSPMAIASTSVFQVHPECYNESIKKDYIDQHKNPFHFGKLQYVNDAKESKRLDQKPGPMIIISADGMCEAGRITHHLKNLLPDPNNTLIAIGYMAEDTCGRKLVDGAKQVKILDKMVEVKADVIQLDGFSSHADYKEMLNWLSAIDTSRLKGIYLVHGEQDALEGLQEELSMSGYKNVEIIKHEQEYNL